MIRKAHIIIRRITVIGAHGALVEATDQNVVDAIFKGGGYIRLITIGKAIMVAVALVSVLHGNVVGVQKTARKRVLHGRRAINGVHITKGDTIGIIEKQIVVSNPDKISASCALASKLLDYPDKFMLSVFCGKESSEAEQEAIKNYVSEKHPDAEIYFIDGGQE